MNVAENLEGLKRELGEGVTLVAVSKVHPVAHIIQAYEAGHMDYGENKVQEMVAKAEVMPKEIRWHLIGHLQRNKVKYIVDFVHMIHSIDSLKLLKEIEKRAAKADRKINCLLQVHIAEEDSKFGFDEDEVRELLSDPEFKSMKHICIKGLMGMATNTEDVGQVRREFQSLRRLYTSLKSAIPASESWQPEILSTGMSGDYKIAIEEGSNMVRIGSAIFGPRNQD